MQTQVFRFKSFHPVIYEIREIKSDKGDDTLTHFVPPMGRPEIIFYIGNRAQIKNTSSVNGFIKGQYTVLKKIDFNPGYHFLSVVLHPYGLKQLFNLKAETLVNAILDIKEHHLTMSLMEIIRDESRINASVAKQIAGIISQSQVYSVSQSTVEFIRLVEQTDKNKINSLIKGRRIGLRTLQRKFKREVGFSPKKFLRIIRMNKIEQQMNENSDAIQIVADFNFADQSHFVKEFKLLRSFSPKEMIKKKLLLADQLPTPAYINV